MWMCIIGIEGLLRVMSRYEVIGSEPKVVLNDEERQLLKDLEKNKINNYSSEHRNRLKQRILKKHAKLAEEASLVEKQMNKLVNI